MMKPKFKIKLGHGVLNKEKGLDYKVLQVSNSISYHPGQILSLDEVDALCRSQIWDVTIVPLP